jgi:multiple sugar transport system permease protein
MFSNPVWAGFNNFVKMFKDARFYRSLGVTARYVIFGVPLQLAFALFLATILNTNLPGFHIFRAIYYVPSLLGGSVTIALLWKQIFGLEGILNKFFLFLGFTQFQDISWMNGPSTAVYTLVVLLVWQFGSCMVIFVAGIQNIPRNPLRGRRDRRRGENRLLFQHYFSYTYPYYFL